MKNIKIYLLYAIFCFVGCKAVKNWSGWGKEEVKQENKLNPTTKIIPPEKIPITSKTVTNWLIYCIITLVVLFAIRYGIKMFKQKDE